ncbi:Alpha/Beta hydrolase protein [Mycena leptocephala]|nr:Alpha/Beta hydrolase protein [Mycena leptocephala]
MLALTIIPLLSLLPGALLRLIFGLGASTGADTRFFGRGEQHAPMPGAVRARRVLLECEHHDVDIRRTLQCAQKHHVPAVRVRRGPSPALLHCANDQSLVDCPRGTDAKNILSILNDVQFGLVPLNVLRFPETAGSGVFLPPDLRAQADSLLAGVMDGLKSTGVKKNRFTGHSLGAALATMTAVMIKDAVDPSVDVSMTGFGLPRGGNQGWADFLACLSNPSSFPLPPLSPFSSSGLPLPSPPSLLVSAILGLTFVSNQNDPVPTVPPKFLGFQHSSGEIYIVDDSHTNFVACPGQDNANCTTGNNVLAVSVQNHLGPYFNDITFGGSQCSS